MAAGRESLRHRLTAQQDGAVDGVRRAESRRHHAGAFRVAGERGAVADRVTGVEADRLGHLGDQDAVPQTDFAQEKRVVVGLGRAGNGARLELAEVLVRSKGVVLRRGHQQHAQRRIVCHLVAGNLDRGRGQRDGFHGRADRVHRFHFQHIGRRQRNLTTAHRERRDTVAGVGDVVAVLGRRQHRVDSHFREVGVRLDGDAPLDVVLVAARAGHVNQQALIHVGIHERLRHRAAHAAVIHSGAQAGHGVAQVNREAGLVDAHARLVIAQASALALGHAATHDRVGAHRLQEVELHLVTLAAAQVHRLDDGHVGAGLLAVGGANHASGARLTLGHRARHAAQRGVALHGLCEQAGSLDKHGVGRARCHIAFRGHG